MHSEFISYDLALEMKELGFNEECFGYMSSDNEIATTLEGSYNSNMNKPSMRGSYCTAILWQQCFKWFREEHGLHIEIIIDGGVDHTGYRLLYVDFNEKEIGKGGGEVYKSHDVGMYETYEQAKQKAIEELIEIVKQKK